MLYSKLFTKTLREAPKDAVTASHKLLVRAGYINQLTGGVWSLLPLGFRVYKKIENIIRREMDALGAEELYLPTLQPREIWARTGRWQTIDPPLFRVKDRHERWYGLGPTHEEVITDLARANISSYKDLPKAVYQIQNKFRNEMRCAGGLLRTREFIMKDLYSFHADEKDLDNFYEKVVVAYHKIYAACGLKAVAVEAPSGSIGGSVSHEFMVLALSGEDKILVCQKCGWGTNLEIGTGISSCPRCQGKLKKENAIEAGHIFKLGITYSEKMGAYFADENGREKPIVMGCYGIGLQRLLGAVCEVYNDKNGLVWPASLSPYDAYLVGLDLENKKVAEFAQRVYKELEKAGKEVLFDERAESAGVKFKDADLIGIPIRLVVSARTGNKIEYKRRDEKECQLFTLKQLLGKMRVSNNYSTLSSRAKARDLKFKDFWHV